MTRNSQETLIKCFALIARGGIHKKISGLEKKVKKVPPPSSPILLIPISSEIDPLGIFLLSLAHHALDSGFTVAQGQHSRVPL